MVVKKEILMAEYLVYQMVDLMENYLAEKKEN
jgi:hypothetical protein